MLQCGGIREWCVYVFACVHPTLADNSNGAKHKHMCVAMAPTTTATSKPICCIAMVTVISQRVGGKEMQREGERWDSKNMRQGMGRITTTVALFLVLPSHCGYRKNISMSPSTFCHLLCKILNVSCLKPVNTYAIENNTPYTTVQKQTTQ